MIWSTWRQHRPEALAAAAVLAGMASLLAFAAAQGAISRDVGSVLSTFVVIALGVLPALAGMFLGAPLLARDLEQGTYRLVWTQGTTRGRWLAAKLVFALAVVVPAAALLGVLTAALVTIPQETLSNGTTMDAVPIWNYFDVSGPALAGYVVFAFALGVAAGAVVGRTYPAMALTLVVYAAVRIFVVALVRPNYLPPLRLQLDTFQAFPRPPGRHDPLYLYSTYQTMSGQTLSDQQVMRLLGGQADQPTSLASHGILSWVSYQPGDRWWAFQSIEAAIFAGLAALFVGLTVYWVSRRLA
ncbi:MAG: hypothetical protein E6J41_15395 [Chloroflexi bacterium]|nr:MAG: hypothetical protein E6J41_15395 [Chloroflexota bacterium]